MTKDQFRNLNTNVMNVKYKSIDGRRTFEISEVSLMYCSN